MSRDTADYARVTSLVLEVPEEVILLLSLRTGRETLPGGIRDGQLHSVPTTPVGAVWVSWTAVRAVVVTRANNLAHPTSLNHIF